MEAKDPLEGSECDHLCERVPPCSEVKVNGPSPQPDRGENTKVSDSPQMKI